MKKNIIKIPNKLNVKLANIHGPVVAGCSKRYKISDISNGLLEHIDIFFTDNEISYSKFIIPKIDQGKFSKINLEGEEVIRKDLPLETHYNSFDSPNWGDHSNGTHTVNLPYKKYPRDFYSPRNVGIEISLSSIDKEKGYCIFNFKTNEILERKDKFFDKKIFQNLNLLQENTFGCGVEPADKSINEYIKILNIDWQILPPGERETFINSILRGRVPSSKDSDVAQKRYDFFNALKPKSIIVGSSGFMRYFGALIEDDLVVFENIEYGNAIYIFYDAWEALSHRSRTELLSGRFGENFDRIIHADGWEDAVKNIVSKKRKK